MTVIQIDLRKSWKSLLPLALFTIASVGVCYAKSMRARQLEQNAAQMYGPDYEWNLKFNGGPSARSQSAMAYDPVRHVSVLFGGLTWVRNLQSTNDTWCWNGTTWTLMEPENAPDPRDSAAMVYEPDRKRLLLFGGRDGHLVFGDTWEWDGRNWHKLLVEGPSARFGAAMCYDASRHRVVLFGGQNPTVMGDTWEWDGIRWSLVDPGSATSPSPRSYATLVFDTDRKLSTLSFGQTYMPQSPNPSPEGTWTWDGHQWARVSTGNGPAIALNAAVYDSSLHREICLGGTDQSTYGGSSNFWEFDGARWIAGNSTFAPWAGVCPAMCYDTERKVIVAFGGAAGISEPGGLTWEFRRSPNSAALSPDGAVIKGGFSSRIKVTLAHAAPADGVVVKLTSDSGGLTFPPTVSFGLGQRTLSIPVTAQAGTVSKQIHIFATVDDITSPLTVEVSP